MLDDTVLNLIADDLQAQATAVRGARIAASHHVSMPLATFHHGYPEQALQALEQWAGRGKSTTPYLYQFSITDQALVPVLHDAFAEAKSSQRGQRAYARQQAPSVTLYVGSSKALLERVKQHLGYGYQRTYALQLCHWLPTALPGSLELHAWRLTADTPGPVVQAIEDHLWLRQRPMFGRQGAR
ncbi:GIY-YIG nuclease family protein [Pseudomonas sp. OTU5201]|uniref:GIY-YIG nuclease family protein n=1 Tax=Pseudomonas sp. OTU5201 TaxID=3043850 RepID=UPI00313D9BC4